MFAWSENHAMIVTAYLARIPRLSYMNEKLSEAHRSSRASSSPTQTCTRRADVVTFLVIFESCLAQTSNDSINFCWSFRSDRKRTRTPMLDCYSSMKSPAMFRQMVQLSFSTTVRGARRSRRIPSHTKKSERSKDPYQQVTNHRTIIFKVQANFYY